MHKILNRICNIFLLLFAVLALSGCLSGGGGGGGSLGSLGDTGGSLSTSFGGGSSSMASVANPEPSSILLLGSGLIGMAIYAKARLKNKGKR